MAKKSGVVKENGKKIQSVKGMVKQDMKFCKMAGARSK